MQKKTSNGYGRSNGGGDGGCDVGGGGSDRVTAGIGMNKAHT